MKNNLKGFLIGAALGLVGSIAYLSYWGDDIFGESTPGMIATILVCSILGFMVGSGIKEKE
jgi:uncharacterized membrane protein YdjX (TVP38/TMEM64 family)